MGKIIDKKEFQEVCCEINKLSPEQRRNQFEIIIEHYKAGKLDIEVVMFMAFILGKDEGEKWFREKISLLAANDEMVVWARKTLRVASQKQKGDSKKLRPLRVKRK